MKWEENVKGINMMWWEEIWYVVGWNEIECNGMKFNAMQCNVMQWSVICDEMRFDVMWNEMNV